MKTRFVTMILMMAMSIAAIAQDNIAENGYVNSSAGFKEMTQYGTYAHFSFESEGLYTADGKTLVKAHPMGYDDTVWIFFVKYGATTIGSGAFNWFPNTASKNKLYVFLPKTVTSIAPDAFGKAVYSVGIYNTENDSPESKFDVNSDGNVDVSDVTAVISEILK